MKMVFGGHRVFAALFPANAGLVLLLSGLMLPLTSSALPIHSDTFWTEGEANFSVDGETRRKAAQIRRLTEYIRETFKVNSNQSIAIVSEAVFQGSKHDIRPELILAIIGVESTFRERAVSSMGARGLMQILPRAHPKKVRAIVPWRRLQPLGFVQTLVRPELGLEQHALRVVEELLAEQL